MQWACSEWSAFVLRNMFETLEDEFEKSKKPLDREIAAFYVRHDPEPC